MHWFGLALLALVLGYVNAWVSPKIAAALPAAAQQSKIAQAFFNGAIILFAVFIAAFVLRFVGVRTVERG
jgi:hypothetical protein